MYSTYLRSVELNDLATKYDSLGCELEFPESCNNVGYPHELAGRLGEAKRHYEFACERRSGIGCFNLGKVLWKDQRVAARSSFKKACEYGFEGGCRIH